MIERLQVYRFAVEISTPVRLTEERQEELAAAMLEALRLAGASFWLDDGDNQLIKVEYVKAVDRVRRYL